MGKNSHQTVCINILNKVTEFFCKKHIGYKTIIQSIFEALKKCLGGIYTFKTPRLNFYDHP